MRQAPPADDSTYVTGLVRADDRPRYYATLLAPAGLRDDLFAIYGFAAEIARVPNRASEPTLGAIRLTWWQDALAGAAAGSNEGATPALRAITTTIARRKLPLAPFDALIEAHAAELYSDPPATLSDLEGRLGETQSVLFQMAAIIVGAAGPETADAAGHSGVAYGIAHRLAGFARDRMRGRTIVPADLLTAHGLSSAALFAAPPPSGLASAVADLTASAHRHLALARAAAAGLPAAIGLAFLPLATVAPLLRRVERLGSAITERDAHLSDIETLLRIIAARLRRGGRSGGG